MTSVQRLLVRAVDLVNRRGKALGVRLVHWTGKRPYPIHPKHLVVHPWHDWYAPYLSPTDAVLDVGCANGAHLARAAAHCRSIVGFDYDLSQLTIAMLTIRELRLAIARVFAWDLTGRFPFPDRSFDAALFLDMIEHLVPRVEVLPEIFRVLKDDGRLLVSGPTARRGGAAPSAPPGSFPRTPTTRSSTPCRNSWPSWPPPGSSPTVRSCPSSSTRRGPEPSTPGAGCRSPSMSG